MGLDVKLSIRGLSLALIILSVGACGQGLPSAGKATSSQAQPTSTKDPLIPTHGPQNTTRPDPTAISSTEMGPCGVADVAWEADDAWRFGFGVTTLNDPGQWAQALGASWYLDWSVQPSPAHQAPQHWQMVRLSESNFHPPLEEIVEIAARFPGNVWLISNEPDVIWQDNTTPERYAEHYHTLYQAIKQADPSAQVSAGGIAMVSDLRLAYLDRVLEAYREQFGEELPTDKWNIHLYTLREERDSWGVEIPPGFDVDQGALWEITDHDRIDLFEAQIRSFRAWMFENGYRDRPLAITEYGILMPETYGFPGEAVQRYMLESFNSLLTLRDLDLGYPADEQRLVQQWAWFSLASERYPTSNLVDLEAGELTILGETFRDCVAEVDGKR